MFSTVAVNGEVTRWEALHLSDFAQGYFFGAGFFTTFRVEAGRPLFLGRHLRRLARSLAVFSKSVRAPPAEHLREASVRETLRMCLEADAALGPGFTGVGKLAASDGQLLLTFRDLPPDTERLQREGRVIDMVIPGAYRRGDSLPNHKGLSYFRQYSLMADLPLLGNEAGQACELPTANIFVLMGDVLATPPLGAPCLPGIVRELLLEEGHLDGVPVVEQDLRLTDLVDARACVFTNSAAVATGVTRLLGRDLPDSLSLAVRVREHIKAMASREE
ncbi:aminotransferase class IV [Myxococcus sp. K15C18031901]|uniref:aminotransferase class IV n=1 Tax=Myxococcus dinghuensis TaxID=2906761 RepID=UPI0020A7A6D7|nr:aminotransferase class IV [Myxococcus dinghuensis]MCP3098070.1 aminotransferase class IV [Myxococcus dinghuensis]